MINTQEVEDFVKEICTDRGPSHGLEHMQKVRDTALAIYNELSERPSVSDVTLVALLHDTYDHKYDSDGSLERKVRQFLMEHNLNPYPYIQCINAISFSKEMKYGKRWFEHVLDPYWIQVRDIVSDADKLEALGEEGGRRCMEYAVELDLDPIPHLLEHMLYKLLILKDQYIVTAPGKQKAHDLHQELIVYALKETLKYLEA